MINIEITGEYKTKYILVDTLKKVIQDIENGIEITTDFEIYGDEEYIEECCGGNCANGCDRYDIDRDNNL